MGKLGEAIKRRLEEKEGKVVQYVFRRRLSVVEEHKATRSTPRRKVCVVEEEQAGAGAAVTPARRERWRTPAKAPGVSPAAMRSWHSGPPRAKVAARQVLVLTPHSKTVRTPGKRRSIEYLFTKSSIKTPRLNMSMEQTPRKRRSVVLGAVRKAGRRLVRRLGLTPSKPRQLDNEGYCRGRGVVVVDTNILLHHLGLMDRLVGRVRRKGWVMFIANAVRHELDGLKRSEEVGYKARQASRWIGDAQKKGGVLGQGRAREGTAVRRMEEQSWVDRRKGDDLILASCLLLQAEGAEVLLVTDDRNLGDEARDNGLQVVESVGL